MYLHFYVKGGPHGIAQTLFHVHVSFPVRTSSQKKPRTNLCICFLIVRTLIFSSTQRLFFCTLRKIDIFFERADLWLQFL